LIVPSKENAHKSLPSLTGLRRQGFDSAK